MAMSMIAALAAAAALQAETPAAAPAVPFRYVPPNIGAEDYPGYALAMGIEGRSLLRLEIGADGRIARCDVVESAGVAILDERACRLYRARGRFTLDPASAPVVAHAPVAWKLGDPVPFNMFAMLTGFERDYPGLRSGYAVPGALLGSLRCTRAGPAAACLLAKRPERSWLGSDLARGPGSLTVVGGVAEGLSFNVDANRRQWVRDALVRRLGSPCREADGTAVWCAPQGWSVTLARGQVTIARVATPGPGV